MSTLYLATEPQALAAELTQALDAHQRQADDLTPVTVVVPNQALQQWLTLHVARTLGVLINVRFRRLEAALWEWFREVDPRTHPAPPELLDGDAYQLLVLAVLLEEPAAALGPLRDYWQRSGATFNRQACRRAWRLAGAMGGLIRDYEYHRQDEFMQRWLRGELAPLDAERRRGQQAQQAIFQHIVAEPDGRRARLNRGAGRNYKTLPQYVKEVMELPEHRPAPSRTLHLFGLTQISPLHLEAIGWLTRCFDLRLYGLNPLATRVPAPITQDALKAVAARYRTAEPTATSPSDDLMRRWGRAGAESLHLLSGLLAQEGFETRRLGPSIVDSAQQSTILGRLQQHLLDPTGTNAERLPQDISLQIVGCPGIMREVETVYNSILHNLNDDPTLRLSDIVVLTTDMARYRPALQAVFDRPPLLVPYSLIDFTAAGASAYGQAALGMLDLALESFTRSRVLAVLQNPCFLARLGLAHADTAVWERWIDALGVHQGWDAAEKAEGGLPASQRHTWRQALRRLRLGRCMQSSPPDHAGPAARFGDLLPYADLDSGDPEQLGAFCQAVEGLLPALAALRRFRGGGRAWAERLRGVLHEFLDVPEDRPEEEAVRRKLFDALDQLESWDHVAATGLPLALVRELLQSRLEGLEAARGTYLAGGVTIAALQPMRPVPFRVSYVLGLNEDCFPGGNRLSSLDLRQQARRDGDIRPAEHQRFLFLETILAARAKLYLLYNRLDTQRDQLLQPAVPVQQLERWLGQHLTVGEFREVPMPLYGHSAEYFDPASSAAYQDVLVQHRHTERLVALADAERRGLIAFTDPAARQEFERLHQSQRRDFSLPPGTTPAPSAPATVRLRDLISFLKNPAEASLRRHLQLASEDDPEVSDFEPLASTPLHASVWCKQVLHELAVCTRVGDLDAALAAWPRRFDECYEEGRLRSHAPDQEFAEADRDHLRRQMHDRIHGAEGLEKFLRQRTHQTFCGPILLGESLAPIGPRLRFPALTLDLPAGARATQARLVGDFFLAWHDLASFDLLFINSAKDADDKRAGHLTQHHLQPLLMYLALLAGDAPGRDGGSGRSLVEPRTVGIHVATRSNLETVMIAPGLIAPTEAVDYLTQLVRDYLDPTCFDHLPLHTLLDKKELRPAYESATDDPGLAAQYAESVQDALDSSERSGGRWLMSELVRALDLQPPSDAYAKVRRRLGLLDRPLAAQRARTAPPAKAKGKSKAAAKKPKPKRAKATRPAAPPRELF